jgi:uncharacterized protein YbjT (DUF2867 family)
MRVVIAGGHGKIALRMTGLLAGEHQVVGIVRNPEHRRAVETAGGQCVVLDLEDASLADVVGILEGAEAAVFAAGAGPGSGAARKETVDRAAAALLAQASEEAAVRRHIQISSMGIERADDPGVEGIFAAYLRAKAAAEQDLRRRDLDWTILRPTRLTDAPGTGRVRLAPSVRSGQISRDDVAAVAVELLQRAAGVRQTLELVSGDTPIAEAVGSLS